MLTPELDDDTDESPPDGNPPPDLPRRVHRLYSADDILRDMLGEEPEPPPGGLELQLPLGAVPSLPNLIPAISEAVGVLRLPEVQAGIDLARIAVPRMEQLLAPMAVQATANFAESMSRVGASLESLGRVAFQDLLSDQMLGFRRIGASLESIAQALPYISRAATYYEKWAAANPCWPLVADVGLERDGWETSLNTLAALPEFALVIEAVRQRGLDAYAATLTVRWVLREAIQNLRNVRSSDMPSNLLLYLLKVVQDALSGQQQLLLPGLLGTGKSRSGPPRQWYTADECRTAVVKAIRYQLGQRSAKLQESVAAQLGFSLSGLRKNLRDFHLDWRELVAEARARR